MEKKALLFAATLSVILFGCKKTETENSIPEIPRTGLELKADKDADNYMVIAIQGDTVVLQNSSSTHDVVTHEAGPVITGTFLNGNKGWASLHTYIGRNLNYGSYTFGLNLYKKTSVANPVADCNLLNDVIGQKKFCTDYTTDYYANVYFRNVVTYWKSESYYERYGTPGNINIISNKKIADKDGCSIYRLRGNCTIKLNDNCIHVITVIIVFQCDFALTN